MNNWDKYFLNIANVVAENSKCLSRKIGAVIVRDKSIISVGYNGPPRGVPPCNEWPDYIQKYGKSDICPRRYMGYKSGEGMEYCPAAHGEANAINNAARNGINVYGAVMYMNCPKSCEKCLTTIINAGIKEIVVTKSESKYKSDVGDYIIKTSGLKVREFDIDE